MWVYRAITYFKGRAQKTRWEVGYVAVREGEEYGNGVYFHPVEIYQDEPGDQPGVTAKDRARRAVHYLNGGQV